MGDGGWGGGGGGGLGEEKNGRVGMRRRSQSPIFLFFSPLSCALAKQVVYSITPRKHVLNAANLIKFHTLVSNIHHQLSMKTIQQYLLNNE